MDYKVYHKTQTEIENQKADFEFGAAIAHGAPFQVCPTYVVDNQGQKRDTWSLSPMEVLAFCLKAGNGEILKCTQISANYPKCSYASQEVKTFALLEEMLAYVEASNSPVVRSLGMDVIGSLHGNALLSKASTVASFETEVRGKPTKTEEIVREYAKHEKTANKSK